MGHRLYNLIPLLRMLPSICCSPTGIEKLGNAKVESISIMAIVMPA